MLKLLRPAVFQGSFRKKRYFEGWYFKHVSGDMAHVLSIIPGVSFVDGDPHGFIQILDGTTGATQYIRYPISACVLSESAFDVRIGDSHFSAAGMDLHIETPTCSLHGSIVYSDMITYPSSWRAPGIMGWYSYVPFMECKHGVISISHTLQGTLTWNGSVLDFSNGTGYIEKDWGTSFPESWIWIHANTFPGSDAAFMFSVAKIPWLGRHFMGHISCFYVGGRLHVFTTYNGSSLEDLRYSGQTLTFTLKNRAYQLHCQVTQRTSGSLHAPVDGTMSRIIKESIDSDIRLELEDVHGTPVFSGTGTHAGLEIIDTIFKHFPNARPTTG